MTFVARLLIALIVPTWSCGSLCNLSESDAEVGLQIHAERLVDDPDYFRRGDRLHRRDRCLDSKTSPWFRGVSCRTWSPLHKWFRLRGLIIISSKIPSKMLGLPVYICAQLFEANLYITITNYIYIYIQAFKVGRVGDDELYSKKVIVALPNLWPKPKVGVRAVEQQKLDDWALRSPVTCPSFLLPCARRPRSCRWLGVGSP